MGWKSIKEHYRIAHIVHVREGKLHIGSPYVTDLIVVTPEGTATSAWQNLSGELARYVRDINADRGLFACLFTQQDTFAASIPVFTFEDGLIVEHACEDPGWPNITHDGILMFDNTFFTDRRKAVDMARKDAAAGVLACEERVSDLEDRLARAQDDLECRKAALARLKGEQGTEAS